MRERRKLTKFTLVLGLLFATPMLWADRIPLVGFDAENQGLNVTLPHPFSLERTITRLNQLKDDNSRLNSGLRGIDSENAFLARTRSKTELTYRLRYLQAFKEIVDARGNLFSPMQVEYLTKTILFYQTPLDTLPHNEMGEVTTASVFDLTSQAYNGMTATDHTAYASDLISDHFQSALGRELELASVENANEQIRIASATELLESYCRDRYPVMVDGNLESFVTRVSSIIERATPFNPTYLASFDYFRQHPLVDSPEYHYRMSLAHLRIRRAQMMYEMLSELKASLDERGESNSRLDLHLEQLAGMWAARPTIASLAEDGLPLLKMMTINNFTEQLSEMMNDIEDNFIDQSRLGFLGTENFFNEQRSRLGNSEFESAFNFVYQQNIDLGLGALTPTLAGQYRRYISGSELPSNPQERERFETFLARIREASERDFRDHPLYKSRIAPVAGFSEVYRRHRARWPNFSAYLDTRELFQEATRDLFRHSAPMGEHLVARELGLTTLADGTSVNPRSRVEKRLEPDEEQGQIRLSLQDYQRRVATRGEELGRALTDSEAREIQLAMQAEARAAYKPGLMIYPADAMITPFSNINHDSVRPLNFQSFDQTLLTFRGGPEVLQQGLISYYGGEYQLDGAIQVSSTSVNPLNRGPYFLEQRVDENGQVELRVEEEGRRGFTLERELVFRGRLEERTPEGLTAVSEGVFYIQSPGIFRLVKGTITYPELEGKRFEVNTIDRNGDLISDENLDYAIFVRPGDYSRFQESSYEDGSLKLKIYSLPFDKVSEEDLNPWVYKKEEATGQHIQYSINPQYIDYEYLDFSEFGLNDFAVKRYISYFSNLDHYCIDKDLDPIENLKNCVDSIKVDPEKKRIQFAFKPSNNGTATYFIFEERTVPSDTGNFEFVEEMWIRRANGGSFMAMTAYYTSQYLSSRDLYLPAADRMNRPWWRKVAQHLDTDTGSITYSGEWPPPVDLAPRGYYGGTGIQFLDDAIEYMEAVGEGNSDPEAVQRRVEENWGSVFVRLQQGFELAWEGAELVVQGVADVGLRGIELFGEENVGPFLGFYRMINWFEAYGIESPHLQGAPDLLHPPDTGILAVALQEIEHDYDKRRLLERYKREYLEFLRDRPGYRNLPDSLFRMAHEIEQMDVMLLATTPGFAQFVVSGASYRGLVDDCLSHIMDDGPNREFAAKAINFTIDVLKGFAMGVPVAYGLRIGGAIVSEAASLAGRAGRSLTGSLYGELINFYQGSRIQGLVLSAQETGARIAQGVNEFMRQDMETLGGRIGPRLARAGQVVDEIWATRLPIVRAQPGHYIGSFDASLFRDIRRRILGSSLQGSNGLNYVTLSRAIERITQVLNTPLWSAAGETGAMSINVSALRSLRSFREAFQALVAQGEFSSALNLLNENRTLFQTLGEMQLFEAYKVMGVEAELGTMIERGAVEEARNLLKRNRGVYRRASLGSRYRNLTNHLIDYGNVLKSLPEAEELLAAVRTRAQEVLAMSSDTTGLGHLGNDLSRLPGVAELEQRLLAQVEAGQYSEAMDALQRGRQVYRANGVDARYAEIFTRMRNLMRAQRLASGAPSLTGLAFDYLLAGPLTTFYDASRLNFALGKLTGAPGFSVNNRDLELTQRLAEQALE